MTENVICRCLCGCMKEIPIYNITGLCLHCYRNHRTWLKERELLEVIEKIP